MPCSICNQTGHNRTTCSNTKPSTAAEKFAAAKAALLASKLKNAKAPAPAPAPALVVPSWRVAPEAFSKFSSPQDTESVSSGSTTSKKGPTTNDNDYILSRVNPVAQGTLDFLFKKLIPKGGWSQEYTLLKSRYLDNPSAFVLDTSQPHISGTDKQRHHTLHVNYYSTYWLHYHLYYEERFNKLRYSRMTTLDCYRNPTTIAAWDTF